MNYYESELFTPTVPDAFEFGSTPPPPRYGYAEMGRLGSANTAVEATGGGVPSLPEEPELEGREWYEYITDPAVALAKGVVAANEAATGLLDLATGGYYSKASERLFGKFDPAAQRAYLEQYSSDEQRAANKKLAEADGFWETQKVMLQNHSTILNGIVESVPSIAMGGLIGRGAVAAKALPKAVGYIAPAIGEGAVMAGAQAENLRLKNDDGLLHSKDYAASLATGGIGSLAGLIGGRVASKAGFDDVDTVIARMWNSGANDAGQQVSTGLAKKILGGAAVEGAEEAVQSATETMAENWATDNPLMEGVSKSVGQGGLIGAAMGGGMNAASSGRAALGAKIAQREEEQLFQKRLQIADMRYQQVGEIKTLDDGHIAVLNRFAEIYPDRINEVQERLDKTYRQRRAELLQGNTDNPTVQDYIDQITKDYQAFDSLDELEQSHEELLAHLQGTPQELADIKKQLNEGYYKRRAEILKDEPITLRQDFPPEEMEAKRERLKNNVVASVEKGVFQRKSTKEAVNAIKQWVKETINGRPMQTEIGRVYFQPRGIKDSFGHSIYPNKIDLTHAVPNVLEQGEYLGSMRDINGRDIDNHYFAGKVQLGGEEHFVFVRARQKEKNSKRFYVHEVFTEEEIKKSGSLSSSIDIREQQATAADKRLPDFYRSIVGSVLNVNENAGKKEGIAKSEKPSSADIRALQTTAASESLSDSRQSIENPALDVNESSTPNITENHSEHNRIHSEHNEDRSVKGGEAQQGQWRTQEEMIESLQEAEDTDTLIERYKNIVRHVTAEKGTVSREVATPLIDAFNKRREELAQNKQNIRQTVEQIKGGDLNNNQNNSKIEQKKSEQTIRQTEGDGEARDITSYNSEERTPPVSRTRPLKDELGDSLTREGVISLQRKAENREKGGLVILGSQEEAKAQIEKIGEAGKNSWLSRSWKDKRKQLASLISRFKEDIDGQELTEEQQGIKDVVTGEKKHTEIRKSDLDLVKEYVELEQGQRNRKKGAVHILVDHYSGKRGAVTAQEILDIGSVIREGKIKDVSGGKRIYSLRSQGVRFRVVVAKRKGKEDLITFYSNRKSGIETGLGHNATRGNQPRRLVSNSALLDDIVKDESVDVKKSEDGHIQAFSDGHTTWLVEDGIKDGHGWSVLLHDTGVHVRKLLLKDDVFQLLQTQVKDRQSEDSKTGAAIRSAIKRAEGDKGAPHYWEEVLAYMVEDAPDVGLVRRVLARIKAAAYQILGEHATKHIKLSEKDLRALAQIALKREAKQESGSRKQETEGLTEDSFPREFVVFDSTQIKSATGNTGAFDGSNPDIRFSRKPEAKKNLYVAHNTDASKILHIKDLGGLAAPSLAVTSKDNEYSSYGDITLLADPKILESEKAQVFDADVYSARYPDSENILNEKEAGDLIEWSKRGFDKDNFGFSPLSMDTLKRMRDYTGLMYSDAVRLAWLKDKGLEPKRKTDLRKYISNKFRTKKIEAEFERFARETFNKVVKERKIFKGFTNSGRKRYASYTLENIVKEMTRGKTQDGEGYFYGAGNIRSAFAKKYSGIKAIKKDREKIVSAKEMEKIKEESQDKLTNLLEYLKPYYRFSADSFGYFDDAGSAIAEGPRGLSEAFDLDAEAHQKINEYIEYIANLPTEYFEAKIRRAVDLSEFTTAIVPRGTNQEAVDYLKEKGLKIRFYKKGEKESRKEAVGRSAVFFSRSKSEGKKAVEQEEQARLLKARKFLDGKPVATLKGTEFSKADAPLVDRVASWFTKHHQGAVNVPGVGRVLLNKRSVKDSIAHGLSREKATAFAAIPDVLTKGMIVERQENWKNRGYDSVSIVAPVRMGGKDYAALAVVRQDVNSNRFYLHEVALKEKLQRDAFKTEALTTENGALNGASSSGAVKNLLQKIYSVKEGGETLKFSRAKSENEEAAEQEEQAKNRLKAAAEFFTNPALTNVVREHYPDLTLFEKIFSSPEWSYKKSRHAWDVFMTHEGRQDLRMRLEDKLLGTVTDEYGRRHGFTQIFTDAEKNHKEAFSEANEYLLETDREQVFFRVKYRDGYAVIVDT